MLLKLKKNLKKNSLFVLILFFVFFLILSNLYFYGNKKSLNNNENEINTFIDESDTKNSFEKEFYLYNFTFIGDHVSVIDKTNVNATINIKFEYEISGPTGWNEIDIFESIGLLFYIKDGSGNLIETFRPPSSNSNHIILPLDPNTNYYGWTLSGSYFYGPADTGTRVSIDPIPIFEDSNGSSVSSGNWWFATFGPVWVSNPNIISLDKDSLILEFYVSNINLLPIEIVFLGYDNKIYESEIIYAENGNELNNIYNGILDVKVNGFDFNKNYSLYTSIYSMDEELILDKFFLFNFETPDPYAWTKWTGASLFIFSGIAWIIIAFILISEKENVMYIPKNIKVNKKVKPKVKPKPLNQIRSEINSKKGKNKK